jgi:hypothetical protein
MSGIGIHRVWKQTRLQGRKNDSRAEVESLTWSFVVRQQCRARAATAMRPRGLIPIHTP